GTVESDARKRVILPAQDRERLPAGDDEQPAHFPASEKVRRQVVAAHSRQLVQERTRPAVWNIEIAHAPIGTEVLRILGVLLADIGESRAARAHIVDLLRERVGGGEGQAAAE